MEQEELARADVEFLFIRSASKTVSPTDKLKAAFVLTRDQVDVLKAAGLKLGAVPAPSVQVEVLGEPTKTITASYYNAVRKEKGRDPEPRMGRDFISTWLNEGDVVTLATDGQSLFAYRSRVAEPSSDQITDAIHRVSTARLREIPLHYGPAEMREVVRVEYVRSPAVIQLVLRRAKGACEYPGCTQGLFKGTDMKSYLEVHHIEWLSEGGSDTPENAAALCPSCHRALHHAYDRDQRRLALHVEIKSRPR